MCNDNRSSEARLARTRVAIDKNLTMHPTNGTCEHKMPNLKHRTITVTKVERMGKIHSIIDVMEWANK